MISLLVPVWNERETLPILFDRCRKTLEGMGLAWEILFVDDGSDDGSEELLGTFHREDKRVRVLFLSGNFGQHAALSAGLENANGDVIIIMDADLQFDPEDIPVLVNTIFQGYDLVGGWRMDRKDALLRRRLPSSAINTLIGWTTGVKLRDYNCGFKAMRADVARRVSQEGNRRRYLAPLLANLSERIKEVPVEHHPRRSGVSKYTFSRSVGLMADFFITFQSSPQTPGRQGNLLVAIMHFILRRAGVRTDVTNAQMPLFVIKKMLPESENSRE